MVYAPATISPLGIIFGGFLLLPPIGFLASAPGQGTRAWLRFPLSDAS